MEQEMFFGPQSVGEFLCRETVYFSRYSQLFVAGRKLAQYDLANMELNNAGEEPKVSMHYETFGQTPEIIQTIINEIMNSQKPS